MVADGDLALGGGHAVQGKVSEKCPPETWMILLTDVTRVN